MIQRIQTLFLLASILVLAAMFAVPFGLVKAAAATEPECCQAPHIISQSIILMALAGISAAISIFAIFSYADRPRQIKIIYAAVLATLGLSAGVMYFAYENGYAYGAALPHLAAFFLILAVRAIKKDEALVRSADRLR